MHWSRQPAKGLCERAKALAARRGRENPPTATFVNANPDEAPLERAPLDVRPLALAVDVLPAFGPVALVATIGEWAIRHSVSRDDIEDVRAAVEAAAHDPYRAQDAWGAASDAALAAVVAPAPDELADDADHVDPEVERVFDEAVAAEERALAGLGVKHA